MRVRSDDPEEMVGREDLVAALWDALDVGSLVLSAERRIGKTMALQHLVLKPRDLYLPLYSDLEDLHAPVAFLRRIYDSTTPPQGWGARLSRQARQLYQDMTAAVRLEWNGVTGRFDPAQVSQQNWQEQLRFCLAGVARYQSRSGRTLVFIWDEFPIFLDNVIARSGPGDAAQILQLLRAACQEHRGLRVVLTGSIGLHHILRKLDRAGYRVTLDWHAPAVEPLTPEASALLARRLLMGERVACADTDAVAEAIAQITGGFPFYIHGIVDELRAISDPVQAAHVDAVVDDCLRLRPDTWKLKHFQERVERYYGEEADVAREILYHLCTDHLRVLDFPTLRGFFRFPVADDVLRSAVDLLVLDQYLGRVGDAYAFRSPLVARWWREYGV